MAVVPVMQPGAGTVQAQEVLRVSQPARVVIRNDRGGIVSRRVAEIAQIRAQGQSVEIRGRICYSSCTMYLGLPNTCVEPDTSFGFHGPTHFGQQLSTRDFDYWSRIIASHYPASLQGWYMEQGRNTQSTYYRISGAELIRLGLRQCQQAGSDQGRPQS
ncbi:MAG: hypothetical protein ACNA7Q_01790 [Rhodobacterales bacterium]